MTKEMSGNSLWVKAGHGYLCALKIHEVIPDLEENTDEVDEGDIVSTRRRLSRTCMNSEDGEAYVSMFSEEHAIMSLIPMRKRPPVS